MFCTECGTQLSDGASFCTNCGHKIEKAAAATSATVSLEKPETAPQAQQPMYSSPSNQTAASQPVQSIYTESNSRVTSGQTGDAMAGASYGAAQGSFASQNSYGAPQNNYGAQNSYGMPQNGYGAQNTYGAPQNNYGAPQNNYGASTASYNYRGPVQAPPKKKGKGCLIAVIIAAVVGLLGLLVMIIAIAAGVLVFGGSSDVPEELDSVMENELNDGYAYSPVTGDFDVEDIYGEWSGTAKLVSVSGAEEMEEYLEDLIGRPLTSSELDGIYGTSAEEEWFEFSTFEGDLDGSGRNTEGIWEMYLDMGDYFDIQYWDIFDAVTYDQYKEGDFSTAAIELDDNNCFEIKVMEMDYIGEYGCVFFDSYDYDVTEDDVKEDGAYGLVIRGQVVEGEYGPEIIGEIVVMFQYGDMSEPYGMAYEYNLDYCYEY